MRGCCAPTRPPVLVELGDASNDVIERRRHLPVGDGRDLGDDGSDLLGERDQGSDIRHAAHAVAFGPVLAPLQVVRLGGKPVAQRLKRLAPVPVGDDTTDLVIR